MEPPARLRRPEAALAPTGRSRDRRKTSVSESSGLPFSLREKWDRRESNSTSFDSRGRFHLPIREYSQRLAVLAAVRVIGSEEFQWDRRESNSTSLDSRGRFHPFGPIEFAAPRYRSAPLMDEVRKDFSGTAESRTQPRSTLGVASFPRREGFAPPRCCSATLMHSVAENAVGPPRVELGSNAPHAQRIPLPHGPIRFDGGQSGV